jgi:hypothetical protein
MTAMLSLQGITHAVLIGVGATLVMDVWLWMLKRLDIQAADWALVGRWIGHLSQGRFAHAAISKARPVPHELGLGWLTHYAVGIAYAGLLVAVQGVDWARAPTLLPALTTGVATVVVPLLVMQPAMGNGSAAAKTPAPLMNCLRSLANHVAFGAGLFLAATMLAAVSR